MIWDALLSELTEEMVRAVLGRVARVSCDARWALEHGRISDRVEHFA